MTTSAETKKEQAGLFSGRLKQATASQHEKLEEHPLSISILRPDISLASYARYLNYMHSVMLAFDHQLLPYLGNNIPEAASRKKSALISEDLDWLQQQEVTLQTIQAYNLPDLKNPCFTMGIAYVIEGSTLGGRIIGKHLQHHLSISSEQGGRFFAGYGERTGLMWKHFMDALTNFTAANNCEDEIIAGATAAFTSIYDHFDKKIAYEN